MFRYLARRHDRKHILKSLERQKRISHNSIAFGLDADLVFSAHAAGKKYLDVNEWAYTNILEGEEFFRPTSSHEPLTEEGNRVVFKSDIETEDDENNTFDCIITKGAPQRNWIVVPNNHALVVFHHWYARN